MDWRHRAVCRNEDPELFFPIGTGIPALLQTAEAKEVCWRCPVASECLTWAMESGQDHGVWGGMSETERRELRRPAAAREAIGRVAQPEPHLIHDKRYARCAMCECRHPIRKDGRIMAHSRGRHGVNGSCSGGGLEPLAEPEPAGPPTRV